MPKAMDNDTLRQILDALEDLSSTDDEELRLRIGERLLDINPDVIEKMDNSGGGLNVMLLKKLDAEGASQKRSNACKKNGYANVGALLKMLKALRDNKARR